MRTLDRYIIRSFITNYLVSFLVMVGLYVVLDMVFNFDEFLGSQTRQDLSGLQLLQGFIATAADYYFYQIFNYFVQLSGLIPVVAAAFTLMRLSHNNELSAIMSAGVPLLRVAMPMVIVAVMLNVLVLADQELAIPNMIPKLIRKHDEVAQSERNSFPIKAMRDDQGGVLVVSRYYPTDGLMKGLSVITNRPDGAKSLLTADTARWETDHWALTGGNTMTGKGAQPAVPVPTDTYKSNISPTEIQLYRSGEFVDWLSTPDIDKLLDRPDTFGKSDLIRTKHGRFTQVLVNIILLLLAISCVLTREPQQLKQAAGRCLLLCALCLTAVFVTRQLAGQPAEFGGRNITLSEAVAYLLGFFFGGVLIMLAASQTIPSGKRLFFASLAIAVAATALLMGWRLLAMNMQEPARWPDTWAALMCWTPVFVFCPMAVWLLDRVKT